MRFVFYFLLLFNLVPMANAQDSFWKRFCERHLVADDPYQFESLSVDELVWVYFSFRNQKHYSRVLISEFKKRLSRELSPDDREILIKTLANEEPGND